MALAFDVTADAAPVPVARSQDKVRLAPAGERILAALLAAACLGVLLTAAWLTPSPAGHGTHQQLGMTPCAWLATFGRPCPTCGMTTSFAHLAHGSPLAALRTQPFGALLALATAVAFWAGLYVATTGSRVGLMFAKLLSARWLWTFTGIWAISWAYKIVTWAG